VHLRRPFADEQTLPDLASAQALHGQGNDLAFAAG
jgi:hypothetical protein